MPELSDLLTYGGPGTAMSGPVVGALVPFVLGPFTTAATVAAGAAEFGFTAPCDLRIQSVSWNFMTAPGAASTLALYRHTAIDGCSGGTAIMAATAITAAGSVEGSGFASSAVRNITKGQVLGFDIAVGVSLAANMVVTVMAYITGHAVADKAVR
jgi:hypothetical protein